MVDHPNLPEGRDVQDVLSSIRRLVSSETEARLSESHRAYVRRSSDKARDAESLRPGGGAKPLLLSPALRVDSPQEPEGPDAPEGADAVADANGAEAAAQVPGVSSDLLRLVPEDQVAPDDAAAAPVEDAPDEDLADVALRELVRSVLREELEGEIGDRISRNLTSFVRKEIAKALAETGAG